MIICALDPGTRETGCVLYNDKFVAPILRMEKHPNAEVRGFIRDCAGCEADIFAIEKMQSYGMPVGTEVFETCEWIGRFIEVALQCHMQIWPVYRKPVVAWLTGTAKGNDASVRKALIARFGKDEVGSIGTDLRSAIAVALFVKSRIEAGVLPPNLLG